MNLNEIKISEKINSREIKSVNIARPPAVFMALALSWLLMVMAACCGCGGGGGGNESVVSQYSSNGLPSVSSLKIGQTEENLLISFSVSDPESDICMVKLYYSSDRGATYSPITDIAGFSGAMPSGSTAVLLWKPLNFSELNLKDLKIKVGISDGAAEGAALASDLFSINIPANKAVGKIAFMSMRGVSRQIYIMNADGTNQYRLTDGANDENFAAISPDGNKIVYTSAGNSKSDLYIMDSNGLNEKRLTVSASGEEYLYPSFSPDSSKIAFIMTLDGRYTLGVINADGSGLSVIQTFDTAAYYPVFWPNQTRIAFSMQEEGKNKIYIIDYESKSMAAFIAGNFNVNYPAFSPDGTKLAFTSDVDGDFEILVRDLVSNTISKITDNAYFDAYPRFTADGSNIIFSSRQSGANQIYSMSAEGGEAVRLTNTLNEEFFATAGAGYVIFAPPRPLLKSITLSDINISGSPVDLSKIKCSAFYEDNTTLSVTPVWSVVSGGGTLSGTSYVADPYSDTDTVILRASYTEYDITRTNDIKVKLSTLISNLRKIFMAAGYNTASDSNSLVESNIYSANSNGSGLTQVTFNDTTALIKAAISPDGTKIAYSGIRDGNIELFVMDLKTYKKRRLTSNSSSDDEPCFTADSSKIIFTSNREGNFELYSMNADGSSQTRLTNNAYDESSPYVAKDGLMLLYTSNRNGYDKVYASLIDPMSGALSDETSVTVGEGNDRNPCFISGNRVAFESDRNGLSQLFAVELSAGSEPKALTSGAANALHPSSISGDNFIVYVVENNFQYGLTILNTDTLQTSDLFSLGKLAAGYSIAYPFFNYNKNFIFYCSLGAHLLFTSLTEGTTYSLVRALNKNSAPSVSPDGTEIFYHSDIDNIGFFDIGQISSISMYDIYSVPAAGGERVKITSASGDITGYYNPSYSSAAAKITATAKVNENLEIYVFDKTGGSLVNLTNNPAADVTSKFSPDGSKIVFVSDRDGNNEIYIMNSDGSGLANLTNNAKNDTDPNFSPDGKKIVFSSDRDGPGQIYTMNADGTGLARITSGGLNCFEPCYSPDGRKIVFSAYTSSLSDGGVFTVNPDGTDPKVILRNTTALRFISPSW
ncbi:MAG TPA: hypothetical protein DC017_02035 [Candidatus Wallbacteria bacterium]|nr:hypothetical protein [Candidatus Wallbacteria bacterium]